MHAAESARGAWRGAEYMLERHAIHGNPKLNALHLLLYSQSIAACQASTARPACVLVLAIAVCSSDASSLQTSTGWKGREPADAKPCPCLVEGAVVPPAPKPAQQPFDFFNADARQKLRGLQPQLPAAATTRRVRRRATRLTRHMHALNYRITFVCGPLPRLFSIH